MNENEWRQLVNNALNNDEAAFERLYKETERSVYFLCLKLLKNEQDAKDASQETYLAAFNGLSTLDDGANFPKWINGIAVNQCKRFFRTPKNESLDEKLEHGADFSDDENFIPEDYAANAEKRRVIMNIIDTELSEVQRQTIILYYYNGLKTNEIASIMNCPEGTVTYRLSAARAKIKEAVLIYEKENKDRLHAIVPIPILTLILRSEAESTVVPDIRLFKNPAASANHLKAGGKTMLNTLKAKIIAGACAAAVVGGGVTAGVVISNNSKNKTESRPAVSAPANVSKPANTSKPANASAPANSSTPTNNSKPADSSATESLTYVKGDDRIVITGCDKSAKRVVIPAEIDGLPVTEIQIEAFEWCKSLTEITIPDSVTSIGRGAFSHCESLTKINIPDGVTLIDKSTFSGCASLTEITIPDSVTSIRLAAFGGCSSLTKINIPDSVISIGENAFMGCASLTEITISDSIVSIDSGTFEDCSGLTKITIPASVTTISNDAFRCCESLTEVTIPHKVKSIGGHAFRECKNLTEISILNPDCKIANSAYTISNDIGEDDKPYYNGVIRGHEGSTAQAYAEKFGYEFKAI